MLTSSFSGDIINASLRQFGASSIKEIRNGILYIAKFELSDELRVIYVFNITKKDRYYLQRVEPYPMSHGDFENAGEVIAFIKRDIEKFRNAQKSHNFPKFLDTSNAMVMFTHAIELLFLERNVPEEDLDSIYRLLQERFAKIKEIHDRAPKVSEQ